MTDHDARLDESLEVTRALLDRMIEDLDAGFAELVRHYGPVMYTVALRVSGQPSDAEDLAAEAFLRAYRALRDYGPDRIAALRPRAWLITILLNTCRNAVRDSARRPRQVPLRDAADPPVAGPSVEELVEGGETLGELARVVAMLPPAQRAAVVLRHVVGMPMAEVATALGCPEGTAKSHASRGLARLRDLYLDTPPTGHGVVTPLRPSARGGALRRHAAGPPPASTDDAAPITAAWREHR